jgi:hypothetical protein
MNAVIEEKSASGPSDLCTVVALYEDETTRARALAAGDYLISQFWEDVELAFHWWRENFLKDPCLAEAAASQASESDFLIICSRDSTDVSPALEAWFELWINRREDREGALVDLTLTPPLKGRVNRRERILREIASRGGFDYMSATQETPQTNALRQSDTRNLDSSLANDFIGGEYRPPSHFGLNE